MTIKVLLADDQGLVRAGFRSLLRRSKDLTVVAEAATGDDAVRQARAAEPDVILMDIRMPGMDGIEATCRILAERPSTKVIILTTFDTDEHVFAALRAGASGFLTKEVEPAELRRRRRRGRGRRGIAVAGRHAARRGAVRPPAHPAER